LRAERVPLLADRLLLSSDAGPEIVSAVIWYRVQPPNEMRISCKRTAYARVNVRSAASSKEAPERNAGLKRLAAACAG